MGRQTRVTLEYYYAELSLSWNPFCPPTELIGTSPGELTTRISQQMKARGFTPLDEAAAAHALPDEVLANAQKAMRVRTGADDDEARAIRERVASCTPAPAPTRGYHRPGAAGMKAML